MTAVFCADCGTECAPVNGRERRPDVPLDAVFSDGSVQPLLITDQPALTLAK